MWNKHILMIEEQIKLNFKFNTFHSQENKRQISVQHETHDMVKHPMRSCSTQASVYITNNI